MNLAPHSKEAEQNVLGMLMLHNELFGKTERLEADHFYDQTNKDIYESIQKLIDDQLQADMFTVDDYLVNAGKDSSMEYLGKLCEFETNTTAFVQYIQIIIDKSTKRKTLDTLGSARDQILNGDDKDALTLAESASNAIQLLTSSTQVSSYSAINPLLKRAIDRIDERFNSDTDIFGLKTGFSRLDANTSGLQPGELIILAARPSMGKTAFAMNLVESALFEQDKPVIVFSLEMPSDQLISRMLSSIGKIDASRVRDGKLQEDDWVKLSNATIKLQDKPLFIDDSANISPSYMRTQIRKISKEHGAPALIMVDYLQLMHIPGYTNNKVGEITEISKLLKAMAKEFECPVVALSQLNRGVEQRPDKRPVNSDLRDSGAIEQDADLILFLYRDEYYNPDTEKKGIASVIISKNRNGEVGEFDLAFIGRYTRFEELSYNEY